MKKLLFILGLIISFACDAQVKQQLGTYGVRTRRMQMDSAGRVPTVQVGIKDGYAGFDTAQVYYSTVDSTLKVYTGSQWLDAVRGGGSTPTWQQTLTVGSTLTGDNTIDGGGFDFIFSGINQGQIESVIGGGDIGKLQMNGGIISLQGSSDSYTTYGEAGAELGLGFIRGYGGTNNMSEITTSISSINIRPKLGNLLIDTLANLSTQNQLMGWTSTSGGDRGEVGYVTIGSGLSLSGGTLSASATGNQLQSQIVILGTSIEAAFSCHDGINKYLMTTSDSAQGTTITNLAVPGNTISNMISDWSAYSDKSTADVIYIGGPANDCDPSSSSATTMAIYQRLIDSINLYKKPSAKILVGAILPCNSRLLSLYGAGGPLKRDTINNAIMGGSFLQATGVNYRINSYNKVLGDGNQNLLRSLDCGDNIHQTDDGSRIMASAIREQIVAMGYLGNSPPIAMNVPVNAARANFDTLVIKSQDNNNETRIQQLDLGAGYPAVVHRTGLSNLAFTQATHAFAPGYTSGGTTNIVLSTGPTLGSGGFSQMFMQNDGTNFKMFSTVNLGAASPLNVIIGGTPGFPGPLKVTSGFNVEVTGNISLMTAGNKLNITTGSNASVGTATLSSGTVTVNTTAVATGSLIFVTYDTPSGTLASGLSAPAGSIVNGTSFVINSLTTAGVVNTLDNSTVRWWIIN